MQRACPRWQTARLQGRSDRAPSPRFRRDWRPTEGLARSSLSVWLVRRGLICNGARHGRPSIQARSLSSDPRSHSWYSRAMGSSGLFEPLGRQFMPLHFGDIFDPIWIAAAIGLVITIVLYNVRTRQLHRHEPLRAMQEWLLWTGLATFSLILIGAIFRFYF